MAAMTIRTRESAMPTQIDCMATCCVRETMAAYCESAAEAVVSSTKARVPWSAPDITAEPVRCVTGSVADTHGYRAARPRTAGRDDDGAVDVTSRRAPD